MTNSYVIEMIAKYKRKGILIDTNLLLLFIVGTTDIDFISKIKRTNIFTVEDYYTVISILENFQKIFTTPNILTEVSNFLGQTDKEKKEKCFYVLATNIQVLEERYVKSSEIVATHAFARLLELTDSTIVEIAKDNCLVLTTDLPLYHYLITVGIDAINFNHLRNI